MNFKEWLLNESALQYSSEYPGWNSLQRTGMLHSLPQETKNMLSKSIYDSMQMGHKGNDFRPRPINGEQFTNMLRHQFTNYDYETEELRKKDVGCIKLKERCARTHEAYNMVQEIIENLIKPEHIASCMAANKAFLVNKLKEYSDEEPRLRAINKRIPSPQDEYEARKKGVITKKAATCRDLFPDMCSLTTNT